MRGAGSNPCIYSRNIERLKEEMKNITEPRRTRYGNIRHKLEDIIIIASIKADLKAKKVELKKLDTELGKLEE